MHKSLALLPLSILTLAAAPALAQEVPHVIFCMGNCFGVSDKGDRVPVTKGTQLAPGMHLETGPDTYAQVKLGRDAAFGVGERARVHFERGGDDRDIVTLDQGRIRVLNGDALGAPAARPVELHTVDGDFILRSADLEVKSLPKVGAVPSPTLVKLNLGDVRLGGVTLTRDAVQGIVGGKIIDRVIPIGDIALATPQREPAPAGPTAAAGKFASPPIVALPVVNLPALEPTPVVTPILLSPAIVSTDLMKTTQIAVMPTYSGTLSTSPTLVNTAPVVPASMILGAQSSIMTSSGLKSLDSIAKDIQTPTSLSSATSTTTLTQTIVYQPPPTTIKSTYSVQNLSR